MKLHRYYLSPVWWPSVYGLWLSFQGVNRWLTRYQHLLHGRIAIKNRKLWHKASKWETNRPQKALSIELLTSSVTAARALWCLSTRSVRSSIRQIFTSSVSIRPAPYSWKYQSYTVRTDTPRQTYAVTFSQNLFY